MSTIKQVNPPRHQTRAAPATPPPAVGLTDSERAALAPPPELLRRAPADVRHDREVYRPDVVAGMIRRERARADRMGGRFSFVVFEPLDGPSAAGKRRSTRAKRLEKIVCRCIRASDEMGRTASAGICAVLPDTAAEGAWKFAARVTHAAGRHHTPTGCAVYTYPTDVPPDGGNRDAGPDHQPSKQPAEGLGGGGPVQRRTLPMELLLAPATPRWKRAVDVSVAGAGLLLTAPFWAAAAAAIKLTSPGPAIFRQTRIGLGGRPFTIYKFRTMVADAEAKKAALRAASEQDGPAFKIARDPRITRVGRLLRMTSLDELPQLFNVLRGDMSLVGPRPLPVDEQAGCDRWHRARLDVAPGLTCIWQVKGRSRVSFDDWMRMDLAYLKKRRVVADLLILLQTVPAVLMSRGAK